MAVSVDFPWSNASPAFRCIDAADVTIIGTTRGDAPIPAVSRGLQDAPTCVVVAGMHSSELTGVWAALEVARRLPLLAEDVAVHVVPAVDLDGVRHNSELDADRPDLAALLQLRNHRDLEGEFDTEGHPEAEALRKWLHGLPRVDAFVSLHAANHLAPGGFVYMGGDDDFVDAIARRFDRLTCEHGLPLLSQDPTGVGGACIADGVFGLPDAPGSCVDFVQNVLDASIIAVTELPVGLVDVAGPVPLARLDDWKRQYADGDPPLDVSVTDCVEQQVAALSGLVADICQNLRRRHALSGHP